MSPDPIVRPRSHSVGSTPNAQPTQIQNQSKSGKVDGKSVKLESTTDVKPRLNLKSESTGGSKSTEGLPMDSVSISEDSPPQISERGSKGVDDKQDKPLTTLLRQINSEPNLKEHQDMLNLTSEIVHEIGGIQPGTPYDLDSLVFSLKECDRYLAEQQEMIEFEEQHPLNLGDTKPLSLHKVNIVGQRVQIEETTKDLLEVPVPPKPFGGGAARDLLGKVEEKYNSVLNELKNTPNSYKAENQLKDVMVDIRAAVQLLQSTPSDRQQMGVVAEQMGKYLKNITEHLNGSFSEVLGSKALAPIAKDVFDLLEGLKTELKAAQSSLIEATGLNPMSEKGIFHSKSFSTLGALNMLKDLREKAEKNPQELVADGPSNKGFEMEVAPEKVIKVLNNAIKFLENRLEGFAQRNSDAPITEKQAEALMGSSGADHGIESKAGKQELLSNLAFFDFEAKDGLPKLPDSSPLVREDGILELFISSALNAAGLKQPDNLRGVLLERRYEALNSQKWLPISKEVLLQRDGQTHKVQSEIVPQSNLGPHFSTMNGGGVVCHRAAEYKHGTTVAVTKLTAEDGTKLFEGIRHGVINCYGISSKKLAKMPTEDLKKMVLDLLQPSETMWKLDKGKPSLSKTLEALQSGSVFDRGFRIKCARHMREAGSYERAQDLVISHLCKNEDKLKLALAESGKKNPQEVVINLNQIGLLTPSPMKNTGTSGPGNEAKMLKEQMKTLEQLASDPQPKKFKIETKDGTKEVTVRVNVTAFNFGVNSGAFEGFKDKTLGKYGALFGSRIAGWNKSDKYNEVAMNKLIGTPKDRKDDTIGGEVGKFIKDKNIPTEKRLIVLQLAQQVAQMWDDKSYKTAGSEPYKMVSRLALLTHMIGGDVSWNCKSGKDRTGGLDVEVKRLAAEIHMTGEVPEPGLDDKETKANRFRMQINGGNFEIQNYNTGAPGFKLGGVHALKGQINEFSGDTRYKYFRGIAGFYGS